MASSAANWSQIKGNKQHNLALASGLGQLTAPANPFTINTSFFQKLKNFPHQDARSYETGVPGKDQRELKGYEAYIPALNPKVGITADSLKFCTKDKNTYALVKDGLESLEHGYRMLACITAQYHLNHEPSTCATMKRYLEENPIDYNST